MTKVFTIIILLVCSVSIQAQSNNTDAKLLKKYSEKELTELKTNASEYEFAKHCINNAFYIGEGSKEKIAASPKEYGKIKIKDLTDINFFELNIELKENDHQPFIIKGTSNLLIVKSRTQILSELKKL